jgi:type VI secretion system protein ImpA
VIDLDLLIEPLSGDNPCGPDLDAAGDLNYLNFFASAESLLPKSYFEVADAEGNRRRFDPNLIDFKSELERVKPLLARTRDLRLVVFLAKIAILARELEGFTTCLQAIAVLLDRYWAEVHPRPEDGELAARQYAIEALDALPTVIMPLQFLPLLTSRRYGPIGYRTCLIAKGEMSPRADDLVLDRAVLDQVFETVEIDQLKQAAVRTGAPVAALSQIMKVWSEKTDSGSVISFERLFVTADGIRKLLEDVVRRRDPATAPTSEAQSGAAVASGGGAIADPSYPGTSAASAFSSIGEAAAALEGVANYFRQSEPSSPALLLVLQAKQMLGKSFVEALRILLPAHVETASINIGRDRFFDLPVERMAGLLEGAADGSTTSERPPAVAVTQRSHALILLEQVGAFYRVVEPSSPVPFLTDRARELAQRDFLTLLQDLLPEEALRSLDKE